MPRLSFLAPRLKALPRLTSCILLTLCLLLAGCGSDGSSTNFTPVSSVAAQPSATQTTPGVIVDTARTQLPASAQVFRISGMDGAGVVVFGPRVVERTSLIPLDGVPSTVQAMRIDVLESTEAAVPVADVVVPVNLSKTPFTIDNPAFVMANDPVVQSFASVGCNRLNYGDRFDTPSSANVAQLVQDFKEIAAMNPRPKYFFFTGDLVMNEAEGTQVLHDQLTAWVQMFEQTALPGSGCEMVALTGNHEMLIFDVKSNTEIPNPPTGKVWSDIMAPYIPASNGPTQAPPNLDHVQRDESRLSFTFRNGDVFYMCINTETWQGGLAESDTSRIPLNWIRDNLAAANADPTIKHIFVFGHKPVGTVATDGELLTIATDQGLPFYALLHAPNGPGVPSKVRAYICAHVHMWDQGIPPNAPAGSTIPQIIAGNGGSSTDELFQPPNSYFGYTILGVTAAGRIVEESWGRPVPHPYKLQAPQPPSTLRARFTLSAH